MKLDKSFLRSKVGHRIFLLLVLCALLPTVALAILSFGHMARQLEAQSYQRLDEASTSTGAGIADRVGGLADEMVTVAALIRERGGKVVPKLLDPHTEHLRGRFRGVAVITPAQKMIPVFGDVPDTPMISAEDRRRLASGRPLLSVDNVTDSDRVLMIQTLDAKSTAFLVGEIEPRYLWADVSRDAGSQLVTACVLGSEGETLFCSVSESISLPEQVNASESVDDGHLEWDNEGETYLTAYRVIFLKSTHPTTRWTVVMSEAESTALAPLTEFKQGFSLVVLLMLCVVFMLSYFEIRKSLVPLEKLREGTERIARGDFSRRVVVGSNDEFDELAAAFNVMAAKLARQFNVLTTMSRIDRAILASLNQRTIIDTVMTEVPAAFPCDALGLIPLDREAPVEAGLHVSLRGEKEERFNKAVFITYHDVEKLDEHPAALFVYTGEEPPGYLAPMAARGISSFCVLPIFLDLRLSGIIVMGYRGAMRLTEDEVTEARQMVNKVAVAFTNAGLTSERDILNVGALTALARAIDAKSPWTAGHSERVTTMALKIGREMKLDRHNLGIILRGGMLHDIGKIATPQDILDKPGGLTDEERKSIQSHVWQGARILEPIPAFKEIMPIVMQHHERYDGKGYPVGLAGEEIFIGARVFAVADCYDALTSDRPYRAAMTEERAIRIIKADSGKAYDPAVVAAFLRVVSPEEAPAPEPEKTPTT